MKPKKTPPTRLEGLEDRLQQAFRGILAPLVGKRLIPDLREQLVSMLRDTVQELFQDTDTSKDLVRMPFGVQCAKCSSKSGRVKVDLAGTTVSIVCSECRGQKWTQPAMQYTWAISAKEFPKHG